MSTALPRILAAASIDTVLLVMLIVVGITVLIFLALVFGYFKLWLQARLSDTPISMARIIGMKFRRVDPARIVLCAIRLRQAGLPYDVDALERQYLSGADVSAATTAQIKAYRAAHPPGNRAEPDQNREHTSTPP